MIRIVVVDDEPMVCAHLRTILGSSPDLAVVGEAQDGAAGVEAVIRHRPDLVIMDLRMPGVDGLAAIARITALARPPVILVLTTFDADDHVLRALGAGATGYLLKSTPPADLITLVKAAANGHTVMSRPAAAHLVATASRRHEATARLRSLTERERDVLGCLGRGMTNAQIGRLLHLSETTVKGHVSHILVKLHCANRTQAGLLAFEAGLK
ncbi:response regulator [Nonomuraea sp. NPDC050556]|uniref:response regulator n=1 Tax=Nonomuraea sp. NPDC050556 TaxID=3364369 RepID=UPI0037BDEB4F